MVEARCPKMRGCHDVRVAARAIEWSRYRKQKNLMRMVMIRKAGSLIRVAVYEAPVSETWQQCLPS